MILRSFRFQCGMTFRLARYKCKTGPSSNTLRANSTKEILKPNYCIINQYREISNTCCLYNTTDCKSNKMSNVQEWTDWTQMKEMFLKMPVDGKRLQYKCGENYTQASQIPNWQEYATENRDKLPALTEKERSEKLSVDTELNQKVAFWRGDITSLEIDSIVNAANNSLMGGGGVDGAIHSAAGKYLVDECRTLNGCNTGEAKIAGGYKLPAKYVILTVGPRGEQPKKLESCYTYSLHLMKENNLRTTAFPCISTGVYGYPNLNAANVCLNSVRQFLEINRDKVDLVVFCLFLPTDVAIYERLLQKYFPVD